MCYMCERLVTLHQLHVTCLEMTSGASQRGLLAVMEVVFSCVFSTLDRLKSPILTRQCLSTSRFGDFRSLCMMCFECSCSIPCRHAQSYQSQGCTESLI